MKFRKKPVVVEAEIFLKDSPLPFQSQGVCRYGPGGWYVQTFEGPFHISEGDWIIKGVKGEFYLCKPDTFVATYEPVTIAAEE